MTEMLQTNVFFLITSIAVVVVTILVGVVLFYIICILRHVNDVAEKVKEGSKTLENDFANLRKAVLQKGSQLETIFDFFLGRVAPKARAKKTTRKSTAKKTQKKT